MKKRILTGSVILVMVALLFLSRMLTPYIFDCCLAFCAIVACIEIAQVLNKSNKFVNVAISCTMPIVFLVGVIIGVLNERSTIYYIIYFLCILVFYFVFTFIATLLSKDESLNEMKSINVTYGIRKYSVLKALRTTFLFIYPTLFLGSFSLINHFADFSSIVSLYGTATEELEAIDLSIFITFILLFVFVCTMATDIFAMLSGMLFKGKKLCPKISPNKTISGAIGGLIMGVFFTLILFLIFDTNSDFVTVYSRVNLNAFGICLLGFLGSILSQLGDIFASFLKRKAGVKDYGNIFPGHGGVMDRMDGLCFNALFAFIFICILF